MDLVNQESRTTKRTPIQKEVRGDRTIELAVLWNDLVTK